MDSLSLIESIVRSVRHHRDFESAISALHHLKISDEDLFAYFWPRAIKAQKIGENVLFCAHVLYSLKPKCGLTPIEAIQQMRLAWDISLEEVPLYLAGQLSREVVLNAVETLQEEEHAEDPRLVAIRYWLAQEKAGNQ